jgi:hypothetical protein
MKTLKVSPASPRSVWQCGHANQYTRQPRKPLGSMMYLDGLQAQVAKVRVLQEESARELEALMPSVLDRAFKGEL